MEVLRNFGVVEDGRAGFRQVSETSVVEGSSNYYVYATPKDILQNESSPKILSEEEVLRVDVLKRTPGPPAKTTQELEFFELILHGARTRQDMLKDIDNFRRNSPRENPSLQSMLEHMNEDLRNARRQLDELEIAKRDLEQRRNVARSRIIGLPTDSANRILEQEYEAIQDQGESHHAMARPLAVDAVFEPREGDTLERFPESPCHHEGDTRISARASSGF